MTVPELPADLLPAEEDLLYEEEILRDPFSLKLWWRYLQARKDAPARKRRLLFERAIKALPGSYKLWHAYLTERKGAMRGQPLTHPGYEALNNTFERALVTMHKMPRIWLDYLQLLLDQRRISRTRHTFDRALCSLPVTQHDRIWELYVRFVRQDAVPVETALRVYRRYLKFDPTQAEDFINFLQEVGHWQEAAVRLADCVNDPDFVSVKGKTKHQLWLELCDMVTKHAKQVTGLKVDAIIRGGIRRFTDEVGRLWTSLADFYIRKGLFERARDVYEEGMASVLTVRDFSLVFDAYSQFEESVLATKMEAQEASAEAGEGPDVDLRLARLEALMERRPELVSSVLLRQNPHNVHEWHKRVKLFAGDSTRQILTYTEAVKTVDPLKALGKPHTLWVDFAKLYEKHGDLPNARVILEKATQVAYKAVEDLAAVWCEWAEMEIRAHHFQQALALCRRATQQPAETLGRQADSGVEVPVQLRLYKSVKLWSFYVDLEESLGDLASTRRVYERILELRIATPQIIINYAVLLEEGKFFEDAFQVYERGIAVFKYPHVKDIWTTYLTKFVARYGGKKLERARDLFEQAVEKAPPDAALPLYLAYAKLEEDFGLARHAMAVYDRAVKAVADTDKMKVYEIYIARAAEFFGATRTRDIYEAAIESGLPDKDVKAMCLKYAALEKKLQEIDRARAIYVHASQLADPRTDPAFWQEWNDFEVQYGNEDTFREMLRIKRSVSASYSQMHFRIPEHLLVKNQPVEGQEAAARPASDDMAALEQQAQLGNSPGVSRAPQFVSSARATAEMAQAMGVDGSGGEVPLNPDEIELKDEDEEELASDEEDTVQVAQKEVPASVYGDLAEKVKKQQETREEPVGALERIKRQRRQ